MNPDAGYAAPRWRIETFMTGSLRPRLALAPGGSRSRWAFTLYKEPCASACQPFRLDRPHHCKKDAGEQHRMLHNPGEHDAGIHDSSPMICAILSFFVMSASATISSTVASAKT